MPLLRFEGLLRLGIARVDGGSDDEDKALLRAGGLARAVATAVVDDAVEVRDCALLAPPKRKKGWKKPTAGHCSLQNGGVTRLSFYSLEQSGRLLRLAAHL